MFVIPITLPDRPRKSGQFSRMLPPARPTSLQERKEKETALEREKTTALRKKGEESNFGERRRALRALPGISQVAESPTASTGFGSRNNGKREQRGFTATRRRLHWLWSRVHR